MGIITCCGGCKKSLENEQAALHAGWSMLSITSRWRCGVCERELRNVQGAKVSESIDLLPRGSIGALKRLPEPITLHEKPGL